MQGLVTIGAAAGTAELEVAAALCAAAPAPAAFVASAAGAAARPALAALAGASGTPLDELEARSFDVDAPPAIAARHAGGELLPQPLLDGARAAAAQLPEAGLLVVATSGGLLAALAERYSN